MHGARHMFLLVECLVAQIDNNQISVGKSGFQVGGFYQVAAGHGCSLLERDSSIF
jgi:hypothetical protein